MELGDEGLSVWAICAHAHTVTGEAGRPRGPHCSEPRDRLVPQQRLAWSNSRWELVPGWLLRICSLQGMCPFGPPHVSLFIIQKKPFRPEHRRRERDGEEAGSVINPEELSDQVRD